MRMVLVVCASRFREGAIESEPTVRVNRVELKNLKKGVDKERMMW